MGHVWVLGLEVKDNGWHLLTYLYSEWLSLEVTTLHFPYSDLNDEMRTIKWYYATMGMEIKASQSNVVSMV